MQVELLMAQYHICSKSYSLLLHPMVIAKANIPPQVMLHLFMIKQIFIASHKSGTKDATMPLPSDATQALKMSPMH